MGDPLTDTDSLQPGDVVTIAVRLKDKVTRESYWWRRFAVVQDVLGPGYFTAVTCKLHPTEKDMRMVNLQAGHEVVVKLEPHQWPQGVVASRMKLLMTGVVNLSGEG